MSQRLSEKVRKETGAARDHHWKWEGEQESPGADARPQVEAGATDRAKEEENLTVAWGVACPALGHHTTGKFSCILVIILEHSRKT